MMRFFRLLLLLCALCICGASVAVGGAVAQGAVKTPPVPVPARLVVDYAGLFSSQQRSDLEQYLQAFARQTSTQIAVVTMDDLDGYSPAEMAAGLIDNWGIGQKGKGNGVVLLLKPRNDTRGEVFIGTGAGMEGILPDGKVGRIIDQVMLDDLKRGDYFTATAKGVQTIADISRGEYTVDNIPGAGFNPLWVLGGILLIVFVVCSIAKGGVGPGFVQMMWLLMMLARAGGRGGGGGGGFGGFGGGGSFGGGSGRSF